MSKKPKAIRDRVGDLPRACWTVIAIRPRSGRCHDLTWSDVHATISQAEAQQCVAARYLVAACRHKPDVVEYVVRPSSRICA